MEKTFDQQKCYLWATSRCALKEHCRSELYTKLQAKGASPAEANELLDRLERENYLNEARYVRAYISDKFRFDHWGRTKIRQGLALKHIGKQAIDEAMEETITDEAYAEALDAFIRQKMRTTKGDTLYAVRQKVARSAISRGFEPHLVFDALPMGED